MRYFNQIFYIEVPETAVMVKLTSCEIQDGVSLKISKSQYVYRLWFEIS